MKVSKQKSVPPITATKISPSAVTKQTQLVPASGAISTAYVKLFHQQGVKQSTNYQSGDVSYGVEMFVPNNPASIKGGIEACENLVENALGDKLPQMQSLLRGLAAENK